MSVDVCGMCRGADGMGYIAVTCDTYEPSLRALVRVGADIMPAEVHPAPAAVARQWGTPGTTCHVVAFPLLDVDATVELLCGPFGADRIAAQIPFPVFESRVRSRILTVLHPEVAAAMRGLDRMGGELSLELIDLWLGEGDATIFRVRVVSPASEAVPEMGILDRCGNAISTVRVCLENQIVGERRITTWSVIADDVVRNTILVAFVPGSPRRSCVLCMGTAELADRRAYAAQRRYGCMADPAYAGWLACRLPSEMQLKVQAWDAEELTGEPISLLMRVAPATPAAQVSCAVLSVLQQSYSAWELHLLSSDATSLPEGIDELDGRIHVVLDEGASQPALLKRGIAEAAGSHILLASGGAILEPDALWELATAIQENPEADLLFADEDELDTDGVPCRPTMRPPLNIGLLRSRNYLGHLFALSRTALDAIELPGDELAGAEDYDLALKAVEVARHTAHVPRVLFHWMSRPADALPMAGDIVRLGPAHEAGRAALAAHLERQNLAAEVLDGPIPNTYQVRYELGDPAPRVSVVIPNKDHADLLEACVSSVLDKTDYPDFEVLIVENNSTEPATRELYERLAADSRVRVVVWEPPAAGPAFNYSAIINFGVEQAMGDIIITLNNDTDVIAPEWMCALVGALQRPEVGVAGARLLFPDGLVQHAGMIANPEGWFVHPNQNLRAGDFGYEGTLALACDYSMVTGACQAFSRTTFTEVGGYNEELAVGFNDGEFCLRVLERGGVVAYVPQALLHHREFSSRGRELNDPELEARQVRERDLCLTAHRDFLAAGDPAINPNLDTRYGHFELCRD